jgi:Na+/H+ antiporter NhaD/arsenite permease-like protein
LDNLAAAGTAQPPSLWFVLPFAALLLCIAILPLLKGPARWWHHNRNKLLVSVLLALPVLAYYYWLHGSAVAPHGGAVDVYAPGAASLRHMLDKALLEEYLPFMSLLFALYTISGGVQLRGNLAATPAVNTAFLGFGAVLANVFGTTGASMLLIRPLLHANAERLYVRHTVIFFIFLVSNVGGCLLPVGDPPLFLGYLMGVPFFWTLSLAPEWAVVVVLLLGVYYAWDRVMVKRENRAHIELDRRLLSSLHLRGKRNLALLAAVVVCVVVLAPGRRVPGTDVVVAQHVRELVLLALAGVSMLISPAGLRKEVHFSFGPIAEVAALFLGIFITMQVPMEILRVRGSGLGLAQPWEFFWATGSLSAFLDNAPTYAIFLGTAESMGGPAGAVVAMTDGGVVRTDLLTAVSLGAVFMGAMTYIGNGPNFMVKAIAEHRGVRMPSFLGYMAWSACVLLPVYVLITLLFLL